MQFGVLISGRRVRGSMRGRGSRFGRPGGKSLVRTFMQQDMHAETNKQTKNEHASPLSLSLYLSIYLYIYIGDAALREL